MRLVPIDEPDNSELEFLGEYVEGEAVVRFYRDQHGVVFAETTTDSREWYAYLHEDDLA
jgi:hypothetical protein